MQPAGFYGDSPSPCMIPDTERRRSLINDSSTFPCGRDAFERPLTQGFLQGRGHVGPSHPYHIPYLAYTASLVPFHFAFAPRLESGK